MTKKLSLLFLICILSALNINATVYSGSCGTNVSYSIDTSTGVLKISGTGAMDDFEWKDDYHDYDTPWLPYKAYLKTVDITNGVTSVGKFAFHGCSNLTEVKISNSVTSIGKWAFHGCSALTSINIPDGVTSIGTETFRRCTNLATIVIPDNVTSIGGEAFFECSSLTSLSIGSGIETISNSFKNCPNLTEVYCNAKNVPNTSARAFIDSHVEKATLYVPATSLEAYKATEPWSQFGTIEEIPNVVLRGDVNGDGKVSMSDVMYIVQKILNGKFPDEEDNGSKPGVRFGFYETIPGYSVKIDKVNMDGVSPYVMGSNAVGTNLNTTASQPTWDKANGSYSFVDFANSNDMFVRIDYTLTAEDGSGETIAVKDAIVTIPSQYIQWKPNYKYTYIVKMYDNSNAFNWGETPVFNIFPATFDAIVVEDANGNSTITTITTR